MKGIDTNILIRFLVGDDELKAKKEDIVLAYHPPYKRPYTGFATE